MGNTVSSSTEMFAGQELPPPTEATPEPAALEADDSLPVTVIERRKGWQVVNLHELWRYRELLFFLAWRDVKVRYKQTVLGAAWAVLQPFATMLVFTLFLGRMGGVAGGIEHYPLFVFSGMLLWTFFQNALTAASTSVVGNQNLITKVYFPRLIIPLAAAGAGLVDLAVTLVLLVLMMFYYGVAPGWSLLMAPLVTLLMALAALGVGTLLSALTVAYRDFRYVVPFGVQLWMFATPCIYLDPASAVGPRGQALLPLNPAYGLILNFRQAMLGGAIDWYALWVSGGIAVGLLVVGCMYFRRVERGFADII
jgi:homopolymeric O-antigen transport system permease protein